MMTCIVSAMLRLALIMTVLLWGATTQTYAIPVGSDDILTFQHNASDQTPAPLSPRVFSTTNPAVAAIRDVAITSILVLLTLGGAWKAIERTRRAVARQRQRRRRHGHYKVRS